MKKLIGVITAIFVLSALNISEASASNSAVSQDKQSVGINKSSTDKDVETFNITVNETQLADTLTALHNAGWTITEITKHPTNGTYTIKGERWLRDFFHNRWKGNNNGTSTGAMTILVPATRKGRCTTSPSLRICYPQRNSKKNSN